MLINELGRLLQYFTPIFVKRYKFLEVIDAFLIHFIFNKSDLQINWYIYIYIYVYIHIYIYCPSSSNTFYCVIYRVNRYN